MGTFGLGGAGRSGRNPLLLDDGRRVRTPGPSGREDMNGTLIPVGEGEIDGTPTILENEGGGIFKVFDGGWPCGIPVLLDIGGRGDTLIRLIGPGNDGMLLRLFDGGSGDTLIRLFEGGSGGVSIPLVVDGGTGGVLMLMTDGEVAGILRPLLDGGR